MIGLGKARMAPFGQHNIFESSGITHSVFCAGDGPGVILMHELPGMTPEFWRLANWLSELFTVWVPDLFGNTGTPTPAHPTKLLFKACISREIHLFSQDDPGPVTQWLRALSRELYAECRGLGIGVIGMCMTGNFALTLALDPWVIAPITSQPALPASSLLGNMDSSLQMDEADQQILAMRDIDVMALRFEGDPLCKAARFNAIRALIGEARFHSHVVADEHRNPEGPLKHPHSVLTSDLVDADDSVTKQKLREVIAFLEHRLRAPAAPQAA